MSKVRDVCCTVLRHLLGPIRAAAACTTYSNAKWCKLGVNYQLVVTFDTNNNKGTYTQVRVSTQMAETDPSRSHHPWIIVDSQVE